MSATISITYIDGLAGGHVESVTLAKGTTVQQLLSRKGVSLSPKVFVRVNQVPLAERMASEPEEQGQWVTIDCVLDDGDRVSVTPRTIRGESPRPHSVLDIPPVSVGAVLRPLTSDDDLLGEMLEGRS